MVPFHVLVGARFTDSDYHISESVDSAQPSEMLCEILRFAVGSDGVKTLLPLTHVCARWRRTALGDSSLWTTISLKQTTAPLFDMILAYSGNRLFTVYVDHPDLTRLIMLWKLVDRIEELHYFNDLRQITPFFSSLGPAPNLKVLDVVPVVTVEGIQRASLLIRDLPVIFSGRLPSLRDLTLTNTVGWPAGLFKGLSSFNYSTPSHFPISPIHILGVLRNSPSIEFIRLDCRCDIPSGFDPPTITLRSLGKCTLIGQGTTSLIRFMTIPASAHVFLSKPDIDDRDPLPKFENLSAAQGLHVLDEVCAASFYISDYDVRLQAKNDSGGILDVEMDELYELSQDLMFAALVMSHFECARNCPGFKTAKELELDVDYSRVRGTGEATTFAIDVLSFIRNLPDLEGVKLRGIPPLELASIIVYLHSGGRSCPSLKRLHIESAPFRSPRPMLSELDKLLAKRKKEGRPLQSFTVKMKCNVLISAADHCAFLAAWEGLVEGDVRLEYERSTVENSDSSRRRRRRNYEDESEGDEEEEEEESGYEADEPDDRCVGWDGWPEQWPKTVEEMRRR